MPIDPLVLFIFLIAIDFVTIPVSVNKKIILCILALSILIQMLFISLIPLEPFSDMSAIVNAASQINRGNFSAFSPPDGYLALNPNNIFFSLLLSLWMRVIPSTTFFLKILNIFGNITITLCGYDLYRQISHSNRLFPLLMFACFPPAIMYTNHIYPDVLSTAFFILAIWYFWTHRWASWKTLIWTGFFLGLGDLLRQTGVLFLGAILVYIVLFRKNCFSLLFSITGSYILTRIFAIIPIEYILGHSLSAYAYPVWSYLYMGINPTEFGFQDGTHSIKRTFLDVLERYQSLGFLQVIQIFGKKTFWMWMEGSYQAERYGFGYPSSVTFSYSSAFVDQFLQDQSIFRQLIYAFNYCLYSGLMIFTLLDLMIMLKTKHIQQGNVLFILIFLAFLGFYLVWEIKSRYIFALYPLLILLSSQGCEQVIEIFKFQWQNWRLFQETAKSTGL